MAKTSTEGRRQSPQAWDGTLDKALTTNYILYLWEGYKKYGHDKFVERMTNDAIRQITRQIGLAKRPGISKEAGVLLKGAISLNQSFGQNLREEHKKPVIQFIQEFRDKKANKKEFTKADAAAWFIKAEIAIITEKEDAVLKGKWSDEDRPPDAYKKCGIDLLDYWDVICENAVEIAKQAHDKEQLKKLKTFVKKTCFFCNRFISKKAFKEQKATDGRIDCTKNGRYRTDFSVSVDQFIKELLENPTKEKIKKLYKKQGVVYVLKEEIKPYDGITAHNEWKIPG
jgi:hypothetical protein